MAELLEIYDLQSNLVGMQDRKEFYTEIRKEYEEQGQITRKVKTVKLFLMNADGRIFLQKRSKLKTENSGMYDKTVGGHIVAGDTANMTLVKECAEELGFPAVVASEEEFMNAIKVVDLNVIGIFRKVDYLQNAMSVRKIKGEGDLNTSFEQPQMTSMYVGYYSGAIRFKDGEASGIEVSSLADIKEEIATNPEKFTEDLKFMIDMYAKYLVPVSELLQLG